jgi:DNA-binding NtrC family response regulator
LIIFRSDQPDIILPDREGIETIMDLHREAPDVGIIAISGGGRDGNYSYLPLAEKLGAVRSFEKPIRPPVLLAAIEEMLHGGDDAG